VAKKYSFDDHPEHRAQLDTWRDRWIANALNCEPMTDADRDVTRTAMDGLYRAANLEPPTRGVFVSSPLVGAVACSIASGAWWLRENPHEARKLFGRPVDEKTLMASVAAAAQICVDRCIRSLRGEKVSPLHAATYAATYAATNDATSAATSDATDAATYAATNAATDAATYAATHAATHAATSTATNAATRAATSAATRDATSAATSTATDSPIVDFLIGCAVHWWKFWNGGNMWSGWVAHLTFFRRIAKLPLDYSKFEHYETLAVHAGPRFMHTRFWIASDRPEFIHRDARNRPHRMDGPHIRWRDGVELHHIAGIRVEPRITAGDFTVKDIHEQRNAEVRRVMVDRYNQGDAGRYLRDSGAVVVHEDKDPLGQPRRLLRIDQPGDEPLTAIELTNSTPEPDGSRKLYTIRVHPELRPHIVPGIRSEYGDPQEMTCLNAVAATFGMYGHEYRLEVET
jgi:hypothetical protein